MLNSIVYTTTDVKDWAKETAPAVFITNLFNIANDGLSIIGSNVNRELEVVKKTNENVIENKELMKALATSKAEEIKADALISLGRTLERSSKQMDKLPTETVDRLKKMFPNLMETEPEPKAKTEPEPDASSDSNS